jgi:hypothetical protein
LLVSLTVDRFLSNATAALLSGVRLVRVSALEFARGVLVLGPAKTEGANIKRQSGANAANMNILIRFSPETRGLEELSVIVLTSSAQGYRASFLIMQIIPANSSRKNK